MMPTSQLSSNDFKNIRQALMMHNFLNIFLDIKHFLLNLGLEHLLLGRISRIEQKDDVRLADINLVQKDSKEKYRRRGLARTA